MEQIARIEKVFPDGTAEVTRLPDANCSGNCAACVGCEAQTLMLVANPIHAQPGEQVILEPDTKASRRTTLMLCTIPTTLLLVLYLLGEHFLGRGALFGLVGGAAGLWLVLLLDRKMTRKNPVTYVITGKMTEKGDNTID